MRPIQHAQREDNMINEKMTHVFIENLVISNLLDKSWIVFEIQDHWPYLFLTINIPPDVDDLDVKKILVYAQELAGATLPWHTTEYSWMIAACREGIVVSSVFGGDLSSPRSGYI
jgi:hypothetical protein